MTTLPPAAPATIPAAPPPRPPPPTFALPVAQTLATPQIVYVWLTAFFVSCLLVADIVGVKLFEIHVFGWTIVHTCGMLTFPVTFILTDLINDYYGRTGARRVTWIALCMGLFVFVVLQVALSMPRLDAPYNVSEGAVQAIFGSAQIMYMASLCAFLVGQMLDITIFGLIKKATGGRMIWLRATGSTVVSQAIDSFIVTALAFNVGRRVFNSGVPPIPFLAEQGAVAKDTILTYAATGYTLKFVLALAITPLIYLGHFVLRRWLGMRPLAATAP